MFIRSFRNQCALFCVAGLAACQHAAAPAASAQPKARDAASVERAAPTASAEAPTSSAPTATPAATATAPSPFIDSVRLGYAAYLNVAGGSTFLSTNQLLLRVQGDRVQLEPALLEGLSRRYSQFPRVFGDMPEFGWNLQTSYMERTGRSSLSRWTGSEWVNADNLLQNRNVIGISPWSNRRTLVLVAADDKQLYFTQFGGNRGALPQLPRAARDDYSCVHGVQPAAMSALASGEVYLAGTRCSVAANDDVTTNGVVIHSWAPGAAQAKVSALPGLSAKEAVSGEITSIVAASNRDVFVAGERVPHVPEGEQAKAAAYVAHFDGKDWRALSAPPIDRIEELQRAPDGKLWALYNGQLWTTEGSASESAAWQLVALPEQAKEARGETITSFWVQDNEQVWATIELASATYLVRTKRVSEPLSAPSDEQIAALTQAVDPMAAYHECQSPTLVLLTLSRNAPNDADMPSVRAALRGHRELEGSAQFIELPFLTRRYLGVRGEMDTLLAVRDILVDAHIPGVDPEIRCLTSEPTRTLSVDFVGPKPRKASQSKPRASELSF